MIGILALLTALCSPGPPPYWAFPSEVAPASGQGRLDLYSHSIGPRFKTRISDAVRHGRANLDRRYQSIEWGCGTSCGIFVIVDRGSGRIFHGEEWLTTRGIDTRADSRLVVLDPGPKIAWAEGSTRYFIWNDEQLEFVCSVDSGYDPP